MTMPAGRERKGGTFREKIRAVCSSAGKSEGFLQGVKKGRQSTELEDRLLYKRKEMKDKKSYIPQDKKGKGHVLFLT